MNEIIIINETKNLLIKIVQKRLKGISNIAVCFSGGLDSYLITYIIKNYTKTKINLYTIGFPGSHDYKTYSKNAELLDLKSKFIELSKQLIFDNLKEYLKLTNDKDKVSISYTLPFYILIKSIKENNIISGHGADTLFGGFYKYFKSKNIKSDIKNNFNDFLNKLPDRELLISKKFNKNLILPYTDKTLSKLVLTYPENCFINKGIRKYLLRQIALSLNIPNEICLSNKKAIQYSTGIMKILKQGY